MLELHDVLNVPGSLCPLHYPYCGPSIIRVPSWPCSSCYCSSHHVYILSGTNREGGSASECMPPSKGAFLETALNAFHVAWARILSHDYLSSRETEKHGILAKHRVRVL